jgi:hypothetical protein
MATVTPGIIFGVTEQLTNTKLQQLLTDATVTNINPADLNATNTPNDGDSLTYNAAGSNFTWVP